jgi:Immunoglobulin V-set domain
MSTVSTRQVSWVRQSDLAILASAGVSHTSDSRISAASDAEQGDWQLRIQEALIKDSGLYECQVNTEPKINWPVHLHVEGKQPPVRTCPLLAPHKRPMTARSIGWPNRRAIFSRGLAGPYRQ